MKNNNRRSFFPLILAAAGAAFLLPRTVVGKVLGTTSAPAGTKLADDAGDRAVAALIKKAPHCVAYAPRQRRGSGVL